MSSTKSVGLGDTNFWAYDASLSLLLAELIAVVEDREPADRPGWWLAVEHGLRVQAVVSDFHLDLDLGLDAIERGEFASLLDEATERVERRAAFMPDEANEWRLLEDHAVIFRGSDSADTAAAADLGLAIVALLEGRLAPAPTGTWWFLGAPGGRRTMSMPDQT